MNYVSAETTFFEAASPERAAEGLALSSVEGLVST